MALILWPMDFAPKRSAADRAENGSLRHGLLGGYDPLITHSEDYDLWVRLAAQHRLANLPDVVCGYRLHGNQISASGIRTQTFTSLCVRAAFHGASRELIRESVQTNECDYYPSLLSLGFQSNEIAEAFCTAYFQWVRNLESVGQLEMANRMLAELGGDIAGLESDSRYLASVYWTIIRVSLELHDYLQAIQYFSLALELSPQEVARRLITKLSILFRKRFTLNADH